ncbi:MAG TPA: ATP-grasp domain-containing protein [Caldisericia bacterium]|jgi:carbamoylphosphate synthase large subunit|nr:ATP-grasp domain-containing protein [Caldisericia bacterium]
MAKLQKKSVKKSTATVVKKSVKQVKKVSSGYYAQIRSRHPSHSVVRNKIKLPFRTVIRFGSTTELEDTIDKGGGRIEINTVEAIKNSASKLRMKNCFTLKNVKTADWYYVRKNNFYHIKNHNNQIQEVVIAVENLPYPIVAKHHFGSRGNGNYLLNSQQELQAWMKGKDLSNYLFEKFYNYVREYRVHVSANGCFYTCRKMLKSDIPKEDRWFRNDSNSVWILEENPLFDRPANWTKIVEESVKALKATGLDFGACDVRVQSSKTEKGKKREEIDFIIVEINSAPSFGDITAEKYLQELPKIAHLKKNK